MKLASTLPSVRKVNEVKMARRWFGIAREMQGRGEGQDKATETNAIFSILSKGYLTGIFQLSSWEIIFFQLET